MSRVHPEVDNERALEMHAKYTHAPKETEDPTTELMQEIFRSAGVKGPMEVHTEETIRLCVFSGPHKPKSVNNLEKESKYNKEGYRKVRVLFDTGAGESVAPVDEFSELPIQESEGSKRG